MFKSFTKSWTTSLKLNTWVQQTLQCSLAKLVSGVCISLYFRHCNVLTWRYLETLMTWWQNLLVYCFARDVIVLFHRLILVCKSFSRLNANYYYKSEYRKLYKAQIKSSQIENMFTKYYISSRLKILLPLDLRMAYLWQHVSNFRFLGITQ